MGGPVGRRACPGSYSSCRAPACLPLRSECRCSRPSRTSRCCHSTWTGRRDECWENFWTPWIEFWYESRPVLLFRHTPPAAACPQPWWPGRSSSANTSWSSSPSGSASAPRWAAHTRQAQKLQPPVISNTKFSAVHVYSLIKKMWILNALLTIQFTSSSFNETGADQRGKTQRWKSCFFVGFFLFSRPVAENAQWRHRSGGLSFYGNKPAGKRL